MKTWFSGFVLWLTLTGALAQPAQIIVIRHAEKPEDHEERHLSKAGQARAEALVKFFTRDEHATRRGLPQVLLACHPSHKGHTLRPRETLLPLAQHLKLEVQTPFESKDYAQLAHALLHDPAYRGKAVVVCWVHDSLPAFAAALGVTPEPPKWKDSDYDSAYVITFPEGRAHLKTIAQHLR